MSLKAFGSPPVLAPARVLRAVPETTGQPLSGCIDTDSRRNLPCQSTKPGVTTDGPVDGVYWSCSTAALDRGLVCILRNV